MVDALQLNLTATALILAAVGHVAGAENRGRLRGAGMVAMGGIVVAGMVMIATGLPVEDWPLVFFLSFAAGYAWGAEQEDFKIAPGGALAGVAFAAAGVFFSLTYQWWYGPAAILGALAAGIVRHAWIFLKEARGSEEPRRPQAAALGRENEIE